MNRDSAMSSFLQHWHNLRIACRHVFSRPGFAAVAIVTLALGVGANTAVFSVIDAVLLQAVPYPHADRLLVLDEVRREHGSRTVSWVDFRDWKHQSRSFDAMAAYRTGTATLTGLDQPLLLHTAEVSASFFSILNAAPLAGRTFTTDDDKTGAERTVVISDDFWRTQLGGRAGIIGSSLIIDGFSYEIVGVLPSSLHFFLGRTDVYLPIGLHDADADWNLRGMHPDLLVLARLKPGVGVKSAQADISAVMSRLEIAYPQSNAGLTASVTTLYQRYYGHMQTVLVTILAAVVCVLLMVCVNIGNLLLERSAARRREMAIRTALGADRRRLLVQLVTEGLVLSLSGSALGIILAAVILRWFALGSPAAYEQFGAPHINILVLLCTFASSVIVALGFGLIPAIQVRHVDLNDAFKDGSRRVGATRRARRFQSALLAVQIGLALAVITAAGLMTRSLRNALAVDLGFVPDHLLAMDVVIPSTRYFAPADKTALISQALDRLRELPGVVSVGSARCAPVTHACENDGFMLSDHTPASVVDLPTAALNFVSSSYFEAARIPLLAGRYFTVFDDTHSRNVAIVNSAFARRNWPDGIALGKMIREGGPNGKQPYREIVGIVADVRQDGVEGEEIPEVFLPVTQFPFAPWDSLQSMTFFVRGGDPSTIAARAADAIRAKDKDLLVTGIRVVDRDVQKTFSRRRLITWVFGSFSVLALLLGGIGTYGVMSYAVGQRTREIGTRIALGATRRSIWQMILFETVTLAATGIFLGLIASRAASRWIQSLLFGVGATDPITFSLAAALLVAVAFAAAYLPMRRAVSVDPMVALRDE